MAGPRVSISRLMASVAIVAANFAAARALYATDAEILIGIALMAILLQLSLVFLARSRAHAFWVGFLLGGIFAMATLIWANLTPETLGIDPLTGKAQVSPGSLAYQIWTDYSGPVYDHVGVLFFDPNVNLTPRNSLALVAFMSIVQTLPQLVAAIVGGLLSWGILSVTRRHYRSDGRIVTRLKSHSHDMARDRFLRERPFEI